MKVFLCIFMLLNLSQCLFGLFQNKWTIYRNPPNQTLFANQTSGYATQHLILFNSSISTRLYSSHSNSTVYLVVSPLSNLGEDLRQPRKSLICLYHQNLNQTEVQQTIMFGNMTLNPYQNIQIDIQQSSITIQFWDVPLLIHAGMLIYFGVVAVTGLFLLWKYRIEAGYFGFELFSTLLRWYLKMMLFDQNNGWNYYFPLRLKSYWLLLHVLLATVQICGFLLALKRTTSYAEMVRLIVVFSLVMLPSLLYLPAVVILCVFQLWFSFRQTKLVSCFFVSGSWVYIYVVNLLFSWIFMNPFVLFRGSNILLLLIPFLTLFEMTIFASHININPRVLLWSYLYAYVRNSYLYLLNICYDNLRVGHCSLCEKEVWSFCSLQEQYLIQNDIWLAYRYLVGTPCGHMFHKECLREHLKRQRNCPVDGQVLSRDWIGAVMGQVHVNVAVQILIQMAGVNQGGGNDGAENIPQVQNVPQGEIQLEQNSQIVMEQERE